MWELVLPHHSSEHTRELGIETIVIPLTFRFEMKMWDYIFILNMQHTSLGRIWSLIFLDKRAQDPNKLSVRRTTSRNGSIY